MRKAMVSCQFSLPPIQQFPIATLPLRWKQWLDSNWSQPLLESLLVLLGALTAQPVEGTAVKMEETHLVGPLVHPY